MLRDIFNEVIKNDYLFDFTSARLVKKLMGCAKKSWIIFSLVDILPFFCFWQDIILHILAILHRCVFEIGYIMAKEMINDLFFSSKGLL